MKEKKNFKNAFGQADVHFKINVQLTLDRLKVEERKKSMKKINLRWTIVIAIACILLVSTALAATLKPWGILNMRYRYENGKVLQEAAEIVQHDAPQTGGQGKMATFSVREAVYDGTQVYVVVEVLPTDSEMFLTGTDAWPIENIRIMGPLFEDMDMTIAQYALQNNQSVYHTGLGFDMEHSNGTSLDYLLEEDGTLVYMMSGEYVSDEEELQVKINCYLDPLLDQEGNDISDIQPQEHETIHVTLKNTKASETVSTTEPIIFEQCGIRVDKVTLTRSPMAIYTEVAYTIIDEETYNALENFWEHGFLGFAFIDESGEYLPIGGTGGGIESVEGSTTSFIETGSLQAAETLPSEIILVARNYWEKNRYETKVITFE